MFSFQVAKIIISLLIIVVVSSDGDFYRKKFESTVKDFMYGMEKLVAPPSAPKSQNMFLTREDIERCYYETRRSNSANDPDIKRNLTQIIKAQGYTVKTYKVTTKDGYILTVFRIPYPKTQSKSAPRVKRKSALLTHGLTGSAAQWIMQKGNKNLAMKLADAGYDVWLANNRGNSYSSEHIELTQDDVKYWDFSFHEMGVYDIPAVVDFILKKTGNSKVFYVGHSQGTTQLLVALAEKEEYNDKIEAAFLLAPSAYLGHSSNGIRQLTFLCYNGQYLTNPLLGGKFTAQALIKHLHLGEMCAKSHLTCPLCGNLDTMLFGYDGPQIDFPRLSVALSKFPDTASTKCVAHYAQTITHYPPNFRQFDYMSPVENEERYGDGIYEPPAYDLSKVTTKIIGFYGDNDNLGNPTDSAITFEKLGGNSGNELVRVDWPLWHHMDFAIAKDADYYIYDHILEVMNE